MSKRFITPNLDTEEGRAYWKYVFDSNKRIARWPKGQREAIYKACDMSPGEIVEVEMLAESYRKAEGGEKHQADGRDREIES